MRDDGSATASAGAQAAPPLRVLFFPDYTATNPYQDALYSAFEGVDVAAGDLTEAVDLAAKGPVVFHLHWPEPLFSGCRIADDVDFRIWRFFEDVRRLKRRGGMLVWTAHNVLPHDRRFEAAMLAFHRRLVAEADVVHVHSPEAVAALEAAYGVPVANPVVIPHGSYDGFYPQGADPAAARAALDLPQDAFVVGFVGQLRPYKGLEALVDAFERLRATIDRPVRLLIAGKPVHPVRPGYWSSRARVAVDVTVREGFVPDAELQRLFAASDAVALPYRDILTSGSALLAASFGKPLIAPRLPTLRDVAEAEFGPIYDPEDPDGLFGALRAAVEATPEQAGTWRARARAFAEGRGWGPISARLRATLEAGLADGAGEAETLTLRGRAVRRFAPNAPHAAATGGVGVAFVNHHSAAEVAGACAGLPTEAGGLPVRAFVLDNSEDEGELAALRAIPGAEVLTADENLGYAAGNNLLAARMREAGCRWILVLNPDVRLRPGAIGALLRVAAAEPEAVIAPAVEREDARGHARVSFAGGYVTRRPVIRVSHHMEGAPTHALPAESYEADALHGCAFMAPLTLFAGDDGIPEDYFLYFEETDWFLRLRDRGVRLLVVPAARVVHDKKSHGDAAPSLYYIYYLVRNAFVFNARHGVPAAAVRRFYEQGFLAEWRRKVARTAPGFLAAFDALARAALEDGAAGVTGRVDLAARLDAAAASPGVGFIDAVEPDGLSGWAAAPDGAPVAEVWLLVDDVPVAGFPVDRPRPDVARRGLAAKSGFHVAPPAAALERPGARLELRDSVTGARLRLSSKLARRMGAAHSAPAGELAAPAASRPAAAELRGRVEGWADGCVRGWIYDAAAPDRPVAFDLVVNGLRAEGLPAVLPRADLARAGFGDGRHGFEVPIPWAALADGATEVKAQLYVSGADAPLAERVVRAPAPAGGFRPDFTPEAYLAWAWVNDKTPVYAYEAAAGLQEWFARTLAVETAESADLPDPPLVSVVMPVYNREATLREAIASVAAQSWRRWELIVVDDGSADGSVAAAEAAIEAWPEADIRLIRAPANEGVSAARNRGLAVARGDLIAYLDSDNVWRPQYLQVMAARLVRSPDSDAAYAGQEIWLRNRAFGEEARRHVFATPFCRSRLEWRNFIDLNVFMHRRSLFERLGGFREDMRRLVDWELILRYTTEKPPIFVPALLSRYNIDEQAGQITAVEPHGDNLAKVRGLVRALEARR